MPIYANLAAELKQAASQISQGSQLWIGLAGAPGSGKSTLAEALKTSIGNSLVVIPMDGYHYYRSELDKMDNPQQAHLRRGAPFTFNATRFVDDLIKARNAGKGIFPGFDHGVGDPVENEITLSRSHKIVLVEGNYLLLDTDPWCLLREKVFDITWYLDVPLEECIQRLCKRHVQVGYSEEEARHRVALNDGINAELISNVSPKNADKTIRFSD
jgi:pantothenate kinase